MNKLGRRFSGLFTTQKPTKQRAYRQLRSEQLEDRRLLASDFLYSLSTNQIDREDVNGDGVTSPSDALAVINAMNDRSQVAQGESAGKSGGKQVFKVDVNGDSELSPIDALLVINKLRAEGEHGGATHRVSYTPITLATTVTKGSRNLFFDYVNNGSNDQVVRSAGSWVTDGFAAGNTILISDSGQFVDNNVGLVLGKDENGNDVIGTGDADIRVHNNGIYTVQSVTATTITLDRDLITEFPARSRLDGDLVEGQTVFDNTASFFKVITSVAPGGNFLLGNLVEDLRTVDDDGNALTSVRKGPFSAYADIVFDTALATPTGTGITDVAFFNGLNSQTFADFSTPGLLNEPGGVAFNNPGNAPTGSGPQLIFTTQFRAGNTTGTAMFASNPADLSPNRDTLMFASNFAIPIAEILFNKASLNIVSGPSAVPVIAGPSSLNTNEDTALTLSGFTITDDSANINVTLSLSPNSGTLSSPNFSGTPAQVTTALNNVTYTPLANSNAPVTLNISASDGGATPGTKSVSITINPVNDPPVNTVPGPRTLFNTETLAFGAGTFAVADVDNNTLEVTLTITNQATSQPSSGRLSVVPATGLTVTGNNSNSVKLNGTIAVLNTGLGTLVYDPLDTFIGTDTLTMVTSDGALSDTDTVSLTVAPPQIPFAASDLYLTDEGAGPITLTPSPLANDLKDPGATLNLLSFSPTNAPTATTGSLTVAGGTFTYTPPTDINFFGTETFTYTIEQDPSPSSTGDSRSTGTITINVRPVNDAPVNTVPGAQSVDEDNTLAFSGTKSVRIQDIDAGNGSLTVTLTATRGNINVTAGSGVSNNGSKSVGINGTVSQINNTLGGLTYTPDLNFFGSDTLIINTNDNGNTGSGGALFDNDTVNITINPINDPPTLVVPGKQSFFTDFDNTFSSVPAPFSISDVDAGNNDVEVDLTIGDGALTISNSTGVTVTQNPGSNNGIRIRGTVSNINTALASGVKYRTSTDGNKTLSATVNDLGNTGSGGALTASKSVDVEVLDFVPVDIVGKVFIDHNSDGNRNIGEPEIGGVSVVLSGTDFQGSSVNLTAITDSRGNYSFPALRPNGAAAYTITKQQPAFIQSGRAANQVSLTLDLRGTVNVSGGSLDFGVGGFTPEYADVWDLFALSHEGTNNSGILFGVQGGQKWSIFAGSGWNLNQYSNPRFTPGADRNSGVLTVFDSVANQDRTVNVSTQAGTLTYRGNGVDRVYRVIGSSSLLGALSNGANPEGENQANATTSAAAFTRGVDALFASGGL